MNRFLIQLSFLGLIFCLAGCGGEEKKSRKSGKTTLSGTASVEKNLPFNELVFQIIKENDLDRIAEVTLAADEEDEFRAGVEMELDPGLSERSVKGFKKGLQAVREATAKSEFNWKQAKLIETTVISFDKGSSGIPQPYDPEMEVKSFDAILVIEADGRKIGVKLDDCYALNGKHLVGDGLRFVANP